MKKFSQRAIYETPTTSKDKKTLSMPGLLGIIREVFSKIPRAVKRQTISLADCLMSALAMFGTKSPSLLAFDAPKLEETVSHNLQTLYEIEHPPSDTYMREVLDEIDPKAIREAFLSVFHEAQRGKLLERYVFLDGYLCLVDGTGFKRTKLIVVHPCENYQYGER